MALATTISLAIVGTLTAQRDLVQSRAPLELSKSFSFTDGSAADQANKIFSDQRTIAASADEDLDLNGVLVDALGDTLTFTKLRMLYVHAAAGNTNNVVVGGAVSNAFASLFGDATDKIVVRPGGLVCAVAPDATGYAVAAGTTDILTIANSGADTEVVFDLILIGS